MSVLKEMCITGLYFLTSKFYDVPCIVNDRCLHLEGHLEWIFCSFGKCVYTLGNDDNAVDAIERRIWQLQMIGCIVYDITLAILEHALSLRTWLIFTASFCSMSLCDNVNINIRGCLGSSTSAGMMSHTDTTCHSH